MFSKTFSQRMGLEEIRDTIQINELDEPTRKAIWNVISPFLINDGPNCSVYRDIWTELFNETIDTIPTASDLFQATNCDHYYSYYRKIILSKEWNKCFDLIEFLNNNEFKQKWQHELNLAIVTDEYEIVPIPNEEAYNYVFKKFMVGYRVINGQIISITQDEEIIAIEEAVNQSSDAVIEQISNALRYLSDRNQPDYAKSVHCSISAVEAQCKTLLNNPKPTLSQALKNLEDNGIIIHPSLKEGFNRLYGFTSDAAGIRHASITPSDIDADLAKFMLVACSAFVNYLRSKG